MSEAFDRRISVKVGDARGEGLAFDERFRITLDLAKTLEPDGSTGTVQIFNVSPATRDRLVTDAMFVTIAVGYGNEPMRELFSGDVIRAVYQHERHDTYLEFEMVDGARAIRDTKISVAFAAGTPVRTVLDAILNRLELPVTERNVTVEGIYQEGLAFTGLARDALDKVVAKAGITWSIQDGRIQLLDRNDPAVTSAVRLAPDTGMIASPQKLDDRESKADRARGSGYTVLSLMNPRIRPGDELILSSAGIDEAPYRIESAIHRGDTRGNEWHTEAEVYATS